MQVQKAIQMTYLTKPIKTIMKYITFPTANLNEIIDLTNPIFIQE